ncbi:MAG: flavin reductase family protein [Promethearchaeota archaeon]
MTELKKIALTRAYRCLYPRFTILVTSGTLTHPNVMTVAWASPLSADPPLIGISVTSKRYSYELIIKYKEFCVCVPSITLVKETLKAGQLSGRITPNKFIKCGLTPVASEKIKAPRIQECPIALECVCLDEIVTGDHSLFVGRIVATHVSSDAIDEWGLNPSIRPIYWRNSSKLDVYYPEKL